MPRKARSTGCRVCVQRRVRCDETRPFCQRCIKSKLECCGFPPPIQWVNETSETEEQLQVVSNSASRSATPANLKALEPRRRTPTTSPKDCHKSVTTLSRSLKDSPKNIYFGYFLNQFFATGRWSDFDGNQTWITACLNKEEEHPTSKLAMQSLTKAYFGRRHGQQDIVDEASHAYGKTLLALCEDLKDPRKYLSYDTLAATVAVTLYEQLMFTTKQGWVQHSQGIARLIEMRGPERFLKYPDRAILDMNRYILILQALVSRKRTFLEQDKWIEVGWPEPTPRPHIVRLYDIFARLPGMTEDILRMVNDPSVGAGAVLATQQKIDQIVSDLRVLELEMLVDEPRTADDQSTSSTLPGKPFDTDFKYQHLLAATAWTSLDAILILALEWQYKSRHLDWEKGVNHEGYELIPETRQHALHICQSVEYLLRPEWVHSGAFYLLFPSRMAFLSLPVSSPEALWLVGVLERIAMTSGFEMARNVLTNVQVNEKRSDGAADHKTMRIRALPASPGVS